MNKILLILLILMIGVTNVKAVDIEVKDANTTWKVDASLNSSIPTPIPDRIIIDLANIIYSSYLYDTPPDLDRNLSLVTPRIIVKYANILYHPMLELSGIAFVDIKNNKFNKSYIRVPLYTTVTWINFDSRTHTVTEDSGKFNSGNLYRNQSFEYKFNSPGVYYYHCKIHPYMKGTIIVITPDKIPPASITGLKNISYAPNYINWTWKDPKDIDFEKVLIYINGKYNTSVMKGVQYYKLTNLISDKIYKISTHTVDTGGNINKTWVNYTTKTKDIIPPASITGLRNTTYKRTYINWVWKDPSTVDFSKVMIYINGRFKTNITKGRQFYNATGLINNTLYKISTHTVDYSGNINKTWVNNSAKTAK